MLSTEKMGLSILSPIGSGCIIKCPGLLMLQSTVKEHLPGGTKQSFVSSASLLNNLNAYENTLQLNPENYVPVPPLLLCLNS